jgi:hypothetical protein
LFHAAIFFFFFQNFFSAHGQAVRYAIATRTRDMLAKGDKDRELYEIPNDVKL